MDYMDMLRRGWEISWNNKYLWILGFLAALGGGNSIFTYSFDSGSTNLVTPEQMQTLAAGLIAASCLGLILGIIIWLVSLAARGGLIRSVANIELKQPVDGFGAAFRMGWSKVWSLAGLTIVLFGIVILIVIGLILFFVLSGGALAAIFGTGDQASGTLFAGLGILGLCFLGLLCLLIPIFIGLNFVYPFAMRGMVLRDLGIGDSIRHGWQVLRDHLGPIILLALAFLLFNIIAAVIAGAILLVLGLTVAVPLNLLANTDASFLQGLIVVLGVIAAAIITAVIAMVVVTWQSATFTIAYLNFTGKSIESVKA